MRILLESLPLSSTAVRPAAAGSGRLSSSTAGVRGDGSDVVLGQVRQTRSEFLSPARMAARNGTALLTRLPDRQQPDPVEAEPGDTVQFLVGNLLQRHRLPLLPGQPSQSDAGVDLIEARISDITVHNLCPAGLRTLLSRQTAQAICSARYS